MSNVIADNDTLIPGNKVIRGTENYPVTIQMNNDFFRQYI